MSEDYKNKLWCDLKTDQERVEFLRSGRAWETGIIAQAMVKEIIEVFEFRAKYQIAVDGKLCMCPKMFGDCEFCQGGKCTSKEL